MAYTTGGRMTILLFNNVYIGGKLVISFLSDKNTEGKWLFYVKITYTEVWGFFKIFKWCIYRMGY